MRTTVYVDGFNFYYGCCKGTPYRWVNLQRLAEILLPASDHQITAVHYFTAAIKPRLHDPDQLQRQQLYWRALRTLPLLHLIEGTYLHSRKTMPKVESRPLRAVRRWLARWPRTRRWAEPSRVAVIRTEEKGSDVNLATRLLIDAFDDNFDCAAIVSNDSDLLAPIREVRHRFGKRIGILTGHVRPSRDLAAEAHFLKHIRAGVLQASLFPPELTDATGRFHKPRNW